MSTPVTIYVYADDPILQAGVSSQLRMRPEVRVVGPADLDSAQVAVVVADVLDDDAVKVLRAVQRGGVPRTVPGRQRHRRRHLGPGGRGPGSGV